ncbi:hypothetical protein AB0F17_63475 [Nonomuraea sp. NPDC026600]|uniref:hypothetical protein n=1 Tax=Nonomuraea sp. NPDC026600 TaxID=3155363 RepID=UPI003400C162
MTPSATITRVTITEAPAILTPPTRRGDCWLWIIPSCPYCRSQHTHGAGPDGTVGGSRVPHCTTDERPPAYLITPIPADAA